MDTGWLANQLLLWLVGALLTTLKTLWSLLSQSALLTPDVTVLPQVQAITSRSLVVVNVAFVLAIITAGVTVMTHESLQIRHAVGDLAPRLVVGFVAANFSMPICRTLIDLANAVTTALTGEGIAAKGAFGQLLRVVTDAMSSPTNALLLAVIGLLIAVLTGMLLVLWLARIGVLIVLVGIAPIALACHALPFTDGAARLWWRSMLGVLAVVVLQALALHTALRIFLSPDDNFAALGIPNDPTGTINLLVVACLLWTTVKIPGLVRRYVTRTGQSTVLGMFLRTVLVREVFRVLHIPHPRSGSTAVAGARSVAGGSPPGSAPAANTVIGYWRPRTPRPTPALTATPVAARPAGGSAPASTPVTGGPAAGATPAHAPSPGTAIPALRPTWQASTGASGTGWPDPPPARAPLPPGARPSGTGWPGSSAAGPHYPRTGERRGR